MSYELYLGKGSPSNETSFFEGEPLIARTVSDFKLFVSNDWQNQKFSNCSAMVCNTGFTKKEQCP